jgi:hypothetical protein
MSLREMLSFRVELEKKRCILQDSGEFSTSRKLRGGKQKISKFDRRLQEVWIESRRISMKIFGSFYKNFD